MLADARQENSRILNGIEALERRLSFRIAVLSRLLDRQMSRILAQHGMTLAAYRVLLTIDVFGDTTSAELTRFTVVDQALISRKVAELEKEGLIASRSDPKDSRRRRLSVTAAGKAILETVNVPVERRQSEIMEILDAEEHALLVGVLEKLTGHVVRKLEAADAAG